jgi:hypothetical protein
LPLDVLKIWWERVLAAVSVSIVVWTVADIVLNVFRYLLGAQTKEKNRPGPISDGW